jgi:hypothetical protein
MLVCGANARASGWRDLRIDASSDSRLDDSIQQMRDKLPYNRAVLFDLVLQDLKTRFAPTEYRQQLDGLTYKQVVRLASPNVAAEYLAHYGGGIGSAFSSGPVDGGPVAPAFYPRP